MGHGDSGGLSGRKNLSPKDDIPELGGKVILAPGGQLELSPSINY